jgi:nucleotide-binding universal stress UspA family protein/SAM-dependent methyltransferase
MEPALKKTLKSVTLALRHLLEGHFDTTGTWYPGDLEDRLASIGVRRDRAPRPLNELALTSEDQHARKVVDAYLKLREETGVNHNDAVVEFLRETAYTWANRLIALRCMESRELIDPVILQQDAYGGRSLEHHRLAQRQPELCAGEDDGLFAVLDKVFREQTQRLPMLFNPQAPGIALRPSPAAIKDCFGFLSLNVDTLQKNRIRIREDENALPDAEPPNPFVAPDALGWTYQYWNTEEKDRVFEKVRTVKGTKIAGADIVPATQLYTEDYMVKFLVQNSLGATWMAMHPDSTLSEHWEYYVRDADRAPVVTKPVRAITFLDPACGSGHFLIEAFDLYFAMYQAEGELTEPEDICTAILTQNLFGIDIDARAVQIAEAALWMKAAERSFDYSGAATNLVAATASHLKGPAWEEFLASFTKEPSIGRVLGKFAHTMEHIDEIGSLARPAEDLQAIIHKEHATWEQQVREQKEANFLFPEMRIEALSGQLEFNEISDEEFGDRLFYRARAGIDTFTEKARESGEFDDQMLASETRAGFRLVDLLSRKYDVVAANPPFMGNKTMAPIVKNHLNRYSKDARGELYVAFVERCLELARPESILGFVTQQGWMFSSGLSKFRGAGAEEGSSSGFLRRVSIVSLAHLGPGGFSEISGEVVNTVLVTVTATPSSSESHFVAIRAVEAADPLGKAELLLSNSVGPRFLVPQQVLLTLPGAPVAYWLDPQCFDLLASGNRVEKFAQVVPGLKTGNDSRFLRFHWEAPYRGNATNWVPYSKGGSGYAKWYGQTEYCLDWRNEKIPYRQYRDSRQPYCWLYRTTGFTFSAASKGALGVRALSAGAIFGAKGPGVFPIDGCWIVALLNSRLCSYFVRAMAVGLDILVENVRALPAKPATDTFRQLLEGLGCTAIRLKRTVESSNPLDREFFSPAQFLSRASSDLRRLECEGEIERAVAEYFELDESTLRRAYADVGYATAALPLVRGYAEWPNELGAANDILNIATCSPPARGLTDDDKESIRSKVRLLFETGQWVEDDDDDLDDDLDETGVIREIEDETRAFAPIPPETILEAISQRVGIHHLSVYQILREGIENSGWRSNAEDRRFWIDYLQVTALRILGHRWPRQFEAGEMIPDWADSDGILPFTQVANETTASNRVQERLLGDGVDLVRLSHVVAKPLDLWLSSEFFKHHTKQFKKRPIAWQVQSGSFTARNTPAIACLIYYHKLDSDLLRKVRKMAEDLRKSRETELRGIMSIAQEARSDRQVARRVELEDAVAELQRFDATLETVATTGFGPESLRPKLRQYALDDALLVMKARWLSRLSDLVFAGPLQDWLRAATQTEVHADFGSWITSAMSHLDHHCALVGPQAPDQSDLETDPTAVELAAIIAPQAASMQAKALSLGCDVWWKVLDDAVFAPLKEQIKRLKAEQKECEATLKSEPEPDDATTRKLKARVKELKAEVKSLDKDLKEQTVKAKNVREQIEAWKSDEPATWGDWLAEQPMFDQISSLDHRRPAPKTIAEFIAQESLYAPDINDGVRVNIAPLQKGGILAADVLAAKDLDKAIADRAEWRSDERRWVREGKLPQPGWWPEVATNAET